jgi:hypothetical protein
MTVNTTIYLKKTVESQTLQQHVSDSETLSHLQAVLAVPNVY